MNIVSVARLCSQKCDRPFKPVVVIMKILSVVTVMNLDLCLKLCHVVSFNLRKLVLEKSLNFMFKKVKLDSFGVSCLVFQISAVQISAFSLI